MSIHIFTVCYASLLLPKRCMDSFRGGSVLFMPNDCDNDNLATHDAFKIHPLLTSVWGYYLLVLVTFTGLSTLVSATRFTNAMDNEPSLPASTSSIASHTDASLIAKESVWNYLQGTHSDDSDLECIRRFEFVFLGGALSVMMLHVRSVGDRSSKLHLVEVYRWKYAWMRAFFRFMTNGIVTMIHWLAPTTKKEKIS